MAKDLGRNIMLFQPKDLCRHCSTLCSVFLGGHTVGALYIDVSSLADVLPNGNERNNIRKIPCRRGVSFCMFVYVCVLFCVCVCPSVCLCGQLCSSELNVVNCAPETPDYLTLGAPAAHHSNPATENKFL